LSNHLGDLVSSVHLAINKEEEKWINIKEILKKKSKN
jgi:hypothetical protein